MPAKKIGFGSGCFFQAFSPQKTASQTGGSRYSPGIGRKQAKAWPERVRTEPDRVSVRRSIYRHTETRPLPRSNRGRQHWGRVMWASLP